MGSADIIPGVSGGTIALITGIYERLISAIEAINLKFFLYFFKGFIDKKYFKIARDGFRKIDFNFLIILSFGIAVAFISLANVISFLLDFYPSYTYAFFFGLIITSAIFIFYSNKKDMNVLAWIFIIPGFLSGFFIVGLNSIQAGHSVLIIFFSGIVTFCAMILPGLSGAFILLLIGQYDFMLGILRDIGGFDFSRILFVLSYLIGGLVGLLLFSRILSYLLKKQRGITLSFIVGLMIGALRLPIQLIYQESIDFIIIIFSGIIGILIMVFVTYFANKMPFKGE